MVEEGPGRKIFDPEFCESRCPLCTRARQGNRIAKILQSVEMLVTLGGCPWGRARQKKYGVRPGEPLPPKSE
jgi:hypothetical protein